MMANPQLCERCPHCVYQNAVLTKERQALRTKDPNVYDIRLYNCMVEGARPLGQAPVVWVKARNSEYAKLFFEPGVLCEVPSKCPYILEQRVM